MPNQFLVYKLDADIDALSPTERLQTIMVRSRALAGIDRWDAVKDGCAVMNPNLFRKVGGDAVSHKALNAALVKDGFPFIAINDSAYFVEHPNRPEWIYPFEWSERKYIMPDDTVLFCAEYAPCPT